MRVVVIGGGPAGVSAALHAAELGAEVTLIERGRVGGTALNRGPAPVRTLARAARLVRDWSSWETFGLRGPRPEVDVAATLANAQRVAALSLRTQAHRRPHPLRRCRPRRRGGRRTVRGRRNTSPRPTAARGLRIGSSSPSAVSPVDCRSPGPRSA